MMEFTLSRVALMMCGLILMVSVAAPMSGLFSEEGRDELRDMADDDAGTIDMMVSSGVETVVLSGSVLLPSDKFSIEIHGHALALTDADGKEYRAVLRYDLGDLSLGYGDSVTVYPREILGQGCSSSGDTNQ